MSDRLESIFQAHLVFATQLKDGVVIVCLQESGFIVCGFNSLSRSDESDANYQSTWTAAFPDNRTKLMVFEWATALSFFDLFGCIEDIAHKTAREADRTFESC